MSFVGVTTLTLSNILGAIVSVEPPVEVSVVVVLSEVVLSEVVEVVEEPLSLLLLQEMTERLKMDMRIMYKTLFIFFLHR